jgi:hypothetical protein
VQGESEVSGATIIKKSLKEEKLRRKQLNGLLIPMVQKKSTQLPTPIVKIRF